MDIRRNADRLTLIYTATLSRFGSATSAWAAGLRRCRRDRTWTRSCQTRTPSIFFFWSEKKGGSSAPSEPPLATCLRFRGFPQDCMTETSCCKSRCRLASDYCEWSRSMPGSRLIFFLLTRDRAKRMLKRNIFLLEFGATSSWQRACALSV